MDSHQPDPRVLSSLTRRIHHLQRSKHPSSLSTPLIRQQVTCDSPANFYSAGKHLSALALRDYGKRLDYILYRPAQPTLANPQRSITCLNTSVEFTQPVPGHAFSYSDHFAVSAVFRLSSSAVEQKYPTPLFPGQLESVILALGRHAQNVDKESALLLRIFGACVLAGFVLIPVAASFQPLRYLNWIFPLLSTLVGVVGATALYTGASCFSSEILELG